MAHPAVKYLTGVRPCEFDKISKAINLCGYCPDVCSRKAVPTRGKLPILFVGESPSKIGTLKNDVFRGVAFEIMKQWKGEVYECNASNCHSDPIHPRHVSNCRPWLHAIIKAIQPHGVFAFGRTAERTLVALRGEWNDPEWDLHCFPHPCWIRRVEKAQPFQRQRFIDKVESLMRHYREQDRQKR